MLLTGRVKRSLAGFLTLEVVFVVIYALGIGFPFSNISILGFGVLMILWGSSLWLRVVNQTIRKYMILTVASFVLMYISQLLKYNFLNEYDTAKRYLWYFYYVTLITAPLFVLYVSLNIGRDYESYKPGRERLLYIPVVVFILLFFTNDLHQKVILFYDGMKNWADHYSYNVLYYIIFSWIVGVMLLALFITIKKGNQGGTRRYIWIPIVILLLGIAYAILGTFTNIFVIEGRVILKFQQIYSLVLMFFWESCIQIGLIRSNREYDRIFSQTNVNAVIMDKQNEMVYSTQKYRESGDIFSEIGDDETSQLTDIGMRIHRKEIAGGYVYWLDDVRNLISAQKSLSRANESLSEEGEILKAEKEYNEKEIAIRTRAGIYDHLSLSLEDTLRKMEELVESNMDEKQKLLYISVLGVYVKRWSNLTLLADKSKREGSDTISSTELVLSVNESLVYLKMMGINYTMHYGADFRPGVEMPSDRVIAMYERFELDIERLIVKSLKGGGADD